jgi:hypothetical protein
VLTNADRPDGDPASPWLEEHGGSAVVADYRCVGPSGDAHSGEASPAHWRFECRGGSLGASQPETSLLPCYTSRRTVVLWMDPLELAPDLTSTSATPWTVWPAQLALLLPRWWDRDPHGPPVLRPDGDTWPARAQGRVLGAAGHRDALTHEGSTRLTWNQFSHLGPLEQFVIDSSRTDPEKTAVLIQEGKKRVSVASRPWISDGTGRSRQMRRVLGLHGLLGLGQFGLDTAFCRPLQLIT